MNKNLLILILIFITSGCSIENNNISKNKDYSGSLTITNSGEIKPKEKEINEEKNEIENKKSKIESLRKKLALKGLIAKGDINLSNGDYTSALVKYLQINKELPDDESIINKLAEVYYNLKKFKQSYSYYSKIKDYDKLDKNHVANTLISSVSLNNPENIDYINKELQTLGLNEQELFYYKTSLVCTQDFSECRKEFHDFFDKKELEEKEIQEGTGTIEKEKNFKDLYNVKKALDNYENFQIDDLSYKGALMSGAFFENGLYPVALKTSEILLQERNDYKPLMKIVAKSYYELGDYINAKLYLIKYNKIVPEDNEMSFFLGVVYEKLHEYVLSTIHLQNSLDQGYTDTLDVYKRIIFNYYELGDIDKMLDTFRIIVSKHKDKLSIDDYNIAIYYTLINDDLDKAKDYTINALKKYPDSELFYGYMGWILMEEINRKPVEIKTQNTQENEENQLIAENTQEASTGTTEKMENSIQNKYGNAEKFIDKGLEINSKSPMLNLVKGKLENSKGDYKKSFVYFTKTISIDVNGEFGEIAKKELENIKINK